MQCTTYKFVLMVVLCTIIFANAKKKKSEHRFNRTRPGEMKDRIKKEKRHEEKKHGEIWKPIMSEAWVNKHRTPHHPAWMDYCEPYHCNDYHRPACGLNNNTMRFRWFQSSCHVILNNLCSTYLGTLKYDVVNPRYCEKYIMFLRVGCPLVCPDKLDPTCGVSSLDNQVVMFINKCAMERANCERENYEEFIEVDMKVCKSAIENMSK